MQKIMVMVVALMVCTGMSHALEVFNDDFEAYTLGNPAPSPWTDYSQGGNAVTNYAANSGTQSVNIQLNPDTATPAQGALGRDTGFDSETSFKFSFREDYGYMSFYVYVSNGGSGAGDENQLYCRLLVDYWAGILTSVPGGTSYEPALLAGGGMEGLTIAEFHELEVVLDLDSGVFDLYFNDALIGDSLPMWYIGGNPANGSIMRIYLQPTKSGGNGTFIDDWSLNNSIAPPPMMEGDFLSLWEEDWENHPANDINYFFPPGIQKEGWQIGYDFGLDTPYVVDSESLSGTNSFYTLANPYSPYFMRYATFAGMDNGTIHLSTSGAIKFAFMMPETSEGGANYTCAVMGNGGWMFSLDFLQASGQWCIRERTDALNVIHNDNPLKLWNLGEWSEVVVLYDTDADTHSAYLNGYEITRNSASNPVASANNVHWQLPSTPFEAYFDDFGIGMVAKGGIEDIDMTQDGVELSLIPLDIAGQEQKIFYKDAMTDPWQIADTILGPADLWVDEGDVDRTDPRDSSVAKRFYSWDIGSPEPITALPGYYVVGMTGIESPSDTYTTSVAQYTFSGSETSGTAERKYWKWGLLDGSPYHSFSDRLIGSPPAGIVDPPGTADSDDYIYSLASFLNGESDMVTETGTWSLTGRRISIIWSGGETEYWYITWEEPGSLYKIEAYEVSYMTNPTDFFLTTSFGRNSGAKNFGVGFGGSGPDFYYGAPDGDAYFKNYYGVALGFNDRGTPVTSINDGDMAGLASAGHITDNDVVRYTTPDDGSGAVYAYHAKPASNPGIMARRTMYTGGHDFNLNGQLDLSDHGHIHSGLQIIDGTGKVRGFMFTQYSAIMPWVTTRFWLDSEALDMAPRTGVLPE
jgi:hypothetical protein